MIEFATPESKQHNEDEGQGQNSGDVQISVELCCSIKEKSLNAYLSATKTINIKHEDDGSATNLSKKDRSPERIRQE